MATWIREHRDGESTARIAEVHNSGGLYVAYATGPTGMVSELVDGWAALEVAQAVADCATGCPRKRGCPPWSEIAHKKADPSK